MTRPPAGEPARDPVLDGYRLDQWWDFGDPAGSVERFRSVLPEFPVGSTARAELRTQIARALTLQHQEQEALAELAAAAEEAPRNPLVTARIELEFGRVDNSNGRPAKAVPHFLAAVAAAQAAGNDFLLVDALHMLAIADGARTEQWTAKALAITAATDDRRTRRWIGSLSNNLGWTLHDRGDLTGALTHFILARDAYRVDGSAEQRRVADWAVARVFRSLRRYDEALEIQRELSAGPPDGYVQEELAELLHATGHTEAARAHFAQAADLLAADPWFDEPDRLARLDRLGHS